MKDKIKSAVKVALPLIASALIFLPSLICMFFLGYPNEIYIFHFIVFIFMFFLYPQMIRFVFIRRLEKYENNVLYIIFGVINFFVFFLICFYSFMFYYGIRGNKKDYLLPNITSYFLLQSIFVSIFVFFFFIAIFFDNIIRKNQPLKLKNWVIITSISIIISIILFVLFIKVSPGLF